MSRMLFFILVWIGAVCNCVVHGADTSSACMQVSILSLTEIDLIVTCPMHI